ncbi:WD40 repeat domain-containing protein [Nonomuraea jabiensis]|uniref:WD40 repeat protein n=1 Tax=Nonomuraea jabiensis TaxID=882448 RepID=A0A7W9G8Z3_9ACTN|nr:WD40 repeat domain-containing protein [Nonomuraea jabiensis]MBB5779331.1 WD40 repeat protein [Nonomuraea jabiensis]
MTVPNLDRHPLQKHVSTCALDLAALEELTGDLMVSASPLFDLLVQLIGNGDVDSLRTLHQGGTQLHAALNQPVDYPKPDADLVKKLGLPLGTGATAPAHTLSVLAGLSLCLVTAEPPEAFLRTALEWYAYARTAPESQPWVGVPEPDSGRLDEPLTAISRIVADHGHLTAAAMTVADILRSLAGRPFAYGPTVELGVVFDWEKSGIRAQLRGALVEGASPALVPHPQDMAFFSADEGFQRALTTAWSVAGRSMPGAVHWSLADADEPIVSAVDESLGAAFAIIVEEARRRNRTGLRPPRLWRVSRANVVTGRIDTLGNLQSVDGYKSKLQAVSPGTRVIVPKPDEQRARAAGKDIVIIPASDWRVAAAKARVREWRPLLIWSALPLALTLVASLLIGGLALSAQQQKTAHERVQKLGQQLINDAVDRRRSDPATALRLGIAAYAISPTPEARTSLVQTLIGNHYAGTLFPTVQYQVRMALSPNRKLLAIMGNAGFITLWDVSDVWKPVFRARFGKPVQGPADIAFGPDGRSLVTVDFAGSVVRWDVSDLANVTAKVLRKGDLEDGQSVRLSADGRLVLVRSLLKTPTLWRVGADRLNRLGKLPGADFSSALALGGNGRHLIIGDLQGRISTWDLSDPARPVRLARVRPHGSSIERLALSPDGRHLGVASYDMTASLWDIRDPARPAKLATLNGHEGGVSAIGFSADGRALATGGRDHRVILWDIAGAEPAQQAVLTAHTQMIFDAEFTASGTLLTASFDGTVHRWIPTPSSPAQRSVLREHSRSILATEIGADGRTLLTGSDRGTAFLWDINDPGAPMRLADLPEAAGCACPAALSHDMLLLATHNDVDGRTRLWNVQNPSRPVALSTLPGGKADVAALAFGPDGRTLLVSTADGGALELWDVSDPSRPSRRTIASGAPIDAAAFSRDGTKLVTGDEDGIVTLWSLPGGERHVTEAGVSVWAVAVSPDGRTAATGGRDGPVILWDISGQGPPVRLAVLRAHTRPVRGLTFSQDSRLLATGSDDHRLVLWEVQSRTQLAAFPAHEGEVRAMAFTGDRRTLVTGGTDDLVKLWDIAPMLKAITDPVGQACTMAGRGLDRREWATHIAEENYRMTCTVG